MTALEIAPEWHVRMQAAFQKYTDNAVSKTVNLPQAATREEVASIPRLAYRLGCRALPSTGMAAAKNRSSMQEKLRKSGPTVSGGDQAPAPAGQAPRHQRAQGDPDGKPFPDPKYAR